jgi:hypothetical protein
MATTAGSGFHHIISHQPEDFVDFDTRRGDALHHRYGKW